VTKQWTAKRLYIANVVFRIVQNHCDKGTLAGFRGGAIAPPTDPPLCTILGIFGTVVSVIDSLDGAVRKLSNKRSSIPLWKKYHIVISFNSENGTKVATLAKRFRHPEKDVDYNFEI